MDRRKELDRRYEELRDALCRHANWEPTPTQPATVYAEAMAKRPPYGLGLGTLLWEAVEQLDATRDFMDKQTPTMSWPDGRPEEAFVFSGKTAKFDQPELVRLFGDTMPIEAVNLVFDAPGNMTLGAVRAKVERMAEAWKARQSQGWPPEKVIDHHLAACPSVRPTGGAITVWLRQAGFRIVRGD